MTKKLFLCMLVILILATACAPMAPPTTVSINSINVPTPSTSNTVPTAAPVQPTRIPPSPAPTVIASLNAPFNAANSGSLCPKRSPELELGGAPPYIGEVDDTWRCLGYWSFDLTALPPRARILSATFSPGDCNRVGDPFGLGSLYFKQTFDGQVEVSDYGDALVDADVYSACLEKSFDVSSAVRTGYKVGYVQFVASFDTSDYGNGTGDYISYSGTTPTLTIEYSYVP